MTNDQPDVLERLAIAREALNAAYVAMSCGSGIVSGDLAAVREAYFATDPDRQAASGNDKLAGYEAAKPRSAPKSPPSNAGRADAVSLCEGCPACDAAQALSRSNSPEEAR